MTTTTGASERWQARISSDMAARPRRDAELLGLDVHFPDVGTHPAVVPSVDPVDVRLGHVAVIPVTGTRGPGRTRVRRGTTSPTPTCRVGNRWPVSACWPVEGCSRCVLERLGRQLTG
jgi:hypothetical protein